MLRALIALALSLATSLVMAAVNVNTGDIAALERIKGIGPKVSALMVAAREQKKFTDWHDLITRVKGVGPKAAAKFSAQGLRVDAMPYKP